MIENYNKELINKIKNVDFNTKLVHFHNINRKELNLMYKNFYVTNNCISLNEKDIEVDNLSFVLYENWLVEFNDN